MSKLVWKIVSLLLRLMAKAWAKLQIIAVYHAPEPVRDALLASVVDLLPEITNNWMGKIDIYKRLFRQLEQHGVHLTPNHYYSPIPDTRQVHTKESELIGIDFQLEDQLHLLRSVFPRYQDEYNTFPHEKTTALAPHDFHFSNGIFDGLDALVLYCMVRHFKPKRIIEVGSGWSTRVSARAALENRDTQLVCIEPYPDPVLRGDFPGLTSLISQKVEEVGMALFRTLEEGDILFVDTSHVVKTGEDVNFLYLEVMPRLKKGVIIHVHDIFFPQDYPQWWITDQLVFWNEQYLLQAFLIFNSHFRILFSNNLILLKYFDEVKATFPKCPFFDAGKSFWMQKVV